MALYQRKLAQVLIFSVVIMGGLTGLVFGAMAAESVGMVITIKGIVAVTPDSGDGYFLEKNSPIYEGDVINSTKKSFAVLSFLDQSKIVVRQNTIFVVEGYSLAKGNEISALKLVKGGIRTVTGLIAKNNPDNYKLDTPVASLGVRGTNYDALMCDQACIDEEASGENRKFTPTDSECEIKLGFDQPLPGGYFTVREGIVILKTGDKTLTLGPGDVAFADETRFGCIPGSPDFLLDIATPLPLTNDFRLYSPLQCTP